MKRLALLCLLSLSACTRLPTETASRTPPDARAGGVMMGGGLYTPPTTCKDDNGETVPCP
jgi:hypothetical protein